MDIQLNRDLESDLTLSSINQNHDNYDLAVRIDRVKSVLKIIKNRVGPMIDIPIKYIENTPIIKESK